jgi:hypothetical protein
VIVHCSIVVVNDLEKVGNELQNGYSHLAIDCDYWGSNVVLRSVLGRRNR